MSRYFSSLAVVLAACCISAAAATPCHIDVTVSTPAGTITNPTAPVAIVSVDHFNRGGAYQYTIPGQGSVIVNTSGSTCELIGVSYHLAQPLSAFGGNPTPAQPLFGVNTAFLDDRNDRPFPNYPAVFEGTITYTGLDTATKDTFSWTLPVVLVVTQQTD